MIWTFFAFLWRLEEKKIGPLASLTILRNWKNNASDMHIYSQPLLLDMLSIQITHLGFSNPSKIPIVIIVFFKLWFFFWTLFQLIKKKPYASEIKNYNGSIASCSAIGIFLRQLPVLVLMVSRRQFVIFI